MNTNPLKQIVTKQKAGEHVGIYSCCSANNYVIEAAIERAKKDHAVVLNLQLIRWISLAVIQV